MVLRWLGAAGEKRKKHREGRNLRPCVAISLGVLPATMPAGRTILAGKRSTEDQGI